MSKTQSKNCYSAFACRRQPRDVFHFIRRQGEIEHIQIGPHVLRARRASQRYHPDLQSEPEHNLR